MRNAPPCRRIGGKVLKAHLGQWGPHGSTPMLDPIAWVLPWSDGIRARSPDWGALP